MWCWGGRSSLQPCAGAQAPAWVPLSWKLELPGIRSQAELGSERNNVTEQREIPLSL